ncbi:hypothetical protein LCGC14_2761110, partial [marine sediment metagenome]
VEGKAIAAESHQYYVVNKPVGVVSTAHDPEGRPKVTDLVSSEARLYPVGRLDAATSGLVVLTNDGGLANRLMHPRYRVDKTYRARVQGTVAESALAKLRSGIELREGRTAPAEAGLLAREGDSTVLELAIHEGRKHQVRRMCEAVGHPVESLRRIGYGPLRLGELGPGEARRLEPEEVERLRDVGRSTPATAPDVHPAGGHSDPRKAE